MVEREQVLETPSSSPDNNDICTPVDPCKGGGDLAMGGFTLDRGRRDDYLDGIAPGNDGKDVLQHRTGL